MVIIPSTYLPSIGQIQQIITAQDGVVMDIGDHYIKRSERNRARIMTAQGVMDLTVPVQRANRARQPMHTMLIDNSKRWQHQHWVAILSAYRSSPFFDHYAPYFEPIYRREFERLVDLNAALLSVIFKLLRINLPIEVREEYVEAEEGDIDLRKKGSSERLLSATPYIQVFEDRQPFVANLSILDLLFCEGTNASDFLGVSRR